MGDEVGQNLAETHWRWSGFEPRWLCATAMTFLSEDGLQIERSKPHPARSGSDGDDGPDGVVATRLGCWSPKLGQWWQGPGWRPLPKLQISALVAQEAAEAPWRSAAVAPRWLIVVVAGSKGPRPHNTRIELRCYGWRGRWGGEEEMDGQRRRQAAAAATASG